MHPLDQLFNRPWAMGRRDFMATRASALSLSMDSVKPKAEYESSDVDFEIENGVAVIEICGIIMQQDNWMNRLMAEFFGGCITEVIASQFQAALNNEAVKAILFKVNSPGGDAWGLDELSETIYKSRGKKPIIAHASNMNCSAAYYLSSAADAVYSTKDAFTGCIGSMTSWLNYDGMMEQLGIKEIVIVSECSPDKVPDETTPEGLALYQQNANDLGWLFVDAVARNRGVKREDVTSKFGAGWVKAGKDALKAGMIDGVMSYDKVFTSLQNGRMPTRTASPKGQNMTLAQLLTQPLSAIFGTSEDEPLTPAAVPVATAPAAPAAAAPAVSPAVSPEIQARLDRLASIEAVQAKEAKASYDTRLTDFKAAVASKIEPAKLKSESNPDGLDLDALFAKADAAGLGADLGAVFGATAPHPLFNSVAKPKLDPIEAPGANVPDPNAVDQSARLAALQNTPAGQAALKNGTIVVPAN